MRLTRHHELISTVFAACSVLAALAAQSGCQSPQSTPVQNIRCQLSFSSVDRPADRKRIGELLARYAVPGSLNPPAAAVPQSSDFVYTMSVPRLGVLDDIHAQLLMDSSTSADARQVFNSREPAFKINFDAAAIAGEMQVILRLRTTPGAKLFYKPQDAAEQDLTSKVQPTGLVEFRTNIHRGQDFIYARTVSGQVERFIRINVFSQQVEEIDPRQYP